MFAAGSARALDVPPLTGRVNDRAGLLSAPEASAMEARLAALEAETSHQIAVLTVPTLEGEAIESFALRVAEDWKIGQADLDNGAIVIVASKDRRARIEVGYGLEGVIPDAIAARVMRERMIPRFREGRMGQGIVDGVEALSLAARGEQIPVERLPARRSRGNANDPVAAALFFGLFCGSLVGAFLRKRRVLGAIAGAALSAFVAWTFLSLAFPTVLAGGVGAVLGGSGLSGGGVGGRRGHYPGGFGGGGFGGGGGFSGGGGGFGGGGASGGW